MPRTGVYHPSARETDQEWREKWKFRGEVIAFCLLIAGAVIGYKSLGELSKQTTALTQQTFSGQRAYLLVKNLRLRGSPKALVVGTPMWFEWDVENVGQTPARNPRTSFLFDVRSAAEPPMPDEAGTHGWSFVGGNALGPGDSEISPDTNAVWLEATSGRTWRTDDQQFVDAGARLWVQIIVTYDTVFDGISGKSTHCAYWEASTFSFCGQTVE